MFLLKHFEQCPSGWPQLLAHLRSSYETKKRGKKGKEKKALKLSWRCWKGTSDWDRKMGSMSWYEKLCCCFFFSHSKMRRSNKLFSLFALMFIGFKWWWNHSGCWIECSPAFVVYWCEANMHYQKRIYPHVTARCEAICSAIFLGNLHYHLLLGSGNEVCL